MFQQAVSTWVYTQHSISKVFTSFCSNQRNYFKNAISCVKNMCGNMALRLAPTDCFNMSFDQTNVITSKMQADTVNTCVKHSCGNVALIRQKMIFQRWKKHLISLLALYMRHEDSWKVEGKKNFCIFFLRSEEVEITRNKLLPLLFLVLLPLLLLLLMVVVVPLLLLLLLLFSQMIFH